MEHLVFIKSFSVLVLVVLGLVVVGLIIWQLRKAGGSLSDTFNRAMDNLFGPSTVVMPPNLQNFVNEAVNQEGGYVPWTPTVEDESYPPSWLVKGAS
jgi:hypothetical protein